MHSNPIRSISYEQNLFITLAGTAVLISTTAWSQVVMRVGPPRVIVERPIPRPGHDMLVTRLLPLGGRALCLGRYELPPRPGVVWVAPRWVQRGGSWVFVAGFWRLGQFPLML